MLLQFQSGQRRNRNGDVRKERQSKVRCGPVGHYVQQLWRSCESRQINQTAIRTERVRQQRVADAENDPDRYAGVAAAAIGIRDPLRRANGNSDVRAAARGL